MHIGYSFKLKPADGAAAATRPEGISEQEWELVRGIWPSQVEPTIKVWGGRFPFPVEITLGRDRRRQLAVIHLEVDTADAGGAGSITSTSLREIGAAIGGLLRLIAEHGLDDNAAWSMLLGPLLADAAQPYAGVATRPGRRGHSDGYYQEVARGYLEALEEGEKQPYTLLARRIFKSESQARRLVKRAWQLYPELKPGAAEGVESS